MGTPGDRPHVVIVGGFLTEALFYGPMRERLLARGAARVTVVPIHLPDWLAMGLAGMGPLLLRTAVAIRRARRVAPAPVIVIGHSAGGILARLAMAPEPLDGRLGDVAEDVACLVTLGTPYRFDPRPNWWRHAGVRASEFLDRVTPGTWFAPRTAYLSVGSRCVPWSPVRPVLAPTHSAWLFTRLAVGAQRGAAGDGLVDELRTRLQGATHLAFDDVLHGTFGGPWYGDPHVIDRWWPVAVEAWRSALEARDGLPGGADRQGAGGRPTLARQEILSPGVA